MQKWACTACDYVYDPDLGDPDEGVEPGTPWGEVPETWECPECGMGKDAFEPLEE
ncbi:MAG: rubredoxin [Armatimonadetes bacterium CG_4_10_14_3_um_filter_66_18]|nr:rubredoxin [Armatimonadota bacterium]PIU89042.1 MAG: rubredoxin [Armatimonadetes bacterium CG06_land_8_20_14_3_00_66_21]PIW19302.1 MAG: rubredoxin [Armatimonadetes bacterium CG17_big_fil_post_rev_8_21_14_2_50_66_6]PIX37854.1 MAG: rubredoxin [Armatimonadetes bacterium CG_4_8_14_3_um_filter_66_20]PIY48933.1 MAG: rubredoxin [Armatimonadetes bacterium CG_4_10_14_3_um_filter_66_18]PIZ34005.1 MAG: rubredoxin [Armatimonadetes bacterium CG_4_10_14_0_8_um_filter_66_14]PJB65689.1 MAG: rubredoxin [Ar